MTPRERAQLRLNRHVPGRKDWADRQPARRLSERLVAEPAPMAQRLEVRVREEVKIKKLRGADVSSNAPQLIRLVRHPYALETVRPTHHKGFERPSTSLPAREPIQRPAREMGEIRKEYTFRSPMTQYAHRPEDRPRPFARIRMAQDSDGEDTP